MNIVFKIILLLFLGLPVLQGQQEAQVKGPHANDPEKGRGMIIGKVLDQATETPVDFATISVLNKLDSSIVTGGISELDGKFAIEVDYGSYLVKVEFISYEAALIDNVVLDKDHRLVDLGDVGISPAAQVLAEVNVVAEKSEVR